MVPTLNTARLLLQEIEAEDQAFIFEGLSHPGVIPFYGVRYDTFEATAAQMEWYRQLEEKGSGTAWKLVEKSLGRKVGVIAVYGHKPEHNKAEIGFWLLPQFWKQGFALEALHEVLAYWKNDKALHRLEAFVEDGNTASCKLLQKAGFDYEGIMRDCEIKNGTYISLQIYAMVHT